MPKEKMPITNRLRSYVREFGANTFEIDASVLLCKLCEINYEKRFFFFDILMFLAHIQALI